MQLLVRSLKGKTLALACQSDWRGEDLKAKVQEACGVPASLQRLTFAGKELLDGEYLADCGLEHGNMLSLVARIRGGKGGFGALLRGQGRDGKITTNYDACRDLSGRRLRHINADKKLEEWSRQAKERELEKVALQHLKEKAKEDRAAKKREADVGQIAQLQQSAIAGVQDAVRAGLGIVGSKRPVGELVVPPRKKCRFAQPEDSEEDISSDDDAEGMVAMDNKSKGLQAPPTATDTSKGLLCSDSNQNEGESLTELPDGIGGTSEEEADNVDSDKSKCGSF